MAFYAAMPLMLWGLLTLLACDPDDKVTTYTVSFASNGGSAVAAIEVDEGETVSEPESPTKDNATFKGWYTDNDTFANKFNFSTAITANIRLYAQWTQYYVVTFHLNTGEKAATISVPSGGTASEPNKPLRDNYDFKGWYTDNVTFANKFNFSTAIRKNTALYASWQRRFYTVTFVVTGGSTVQPQRVAAGTTISEPSSIKGNHSLAGWYTDDVTFTNKFDFSTEIKGKTTLYAQWQPSTGPSLRGPFGVVFHSGNFYVASRREEAIIQVDATNGNRTIFSKRGTRGTGDAFSGTLSIEFHNDNFYVLDNGLDAVVQVDATNGNRTIFSKSGTSGSGATAFDTPAGIEFYNDNFYVTDAGLDAVVQVDATSGDRTIFSKSGSGGTGTAFDTPVGIKFYNGNFYVADRVLDAVVQVAIPSGDRTIFSKSGTKGGGPAFSFPTGIEFNNGNFYVTDSTLDAVVQVAIPSGNRTIFSKLSSKGTGPSLDSPEIIIYHEAAFYVTNAGLLDGVRDSLFRVDAATGDRVLWSKKLD